MTTQFIFSAWLRPWERATNLQDRFDDSGEGHSKERDQQVDRYIQDAHVPRNRLGAASLNEPYFGRDRRFTGLKIAARFGIAPTHPS